MSAMQASEMYGVSSRTLYHRLKTMGILTAKMKKRIQNKQNFEIDYGSSRGLQGAARSWTNEDLTIALEHVWNADPPTDNLMLSSNNKQ